MKLPRTHNKTSGFTSFWQAEGASRIRNGFMDSGQDGYQLVTRQARVTGFDISSNKLEDLKSKYKHGKISKAAYIVQMHKIHQYLFDYSQFMKTTDISKIEITDDSVLMTTRDKIIKLVGDRNDRRSIPVEILNFGSYEKEYLDMTLRLIRDGFTVFDIGANTGWYTINIAKAKKKVALFSFEPIPKTFRALAQNLKINKITTPRIFNFGFHNRERKVTFYCYKEGLVNASLRNLSKRRDVEKIKCQVRRMDNFITEEEVKVDFIKCDTEGAELFVIQGGLAAIKRDKPIIFAEMLRKWSAPFGYHPNDIINLLGNFGYRCFIIKEGKLAPFAKMDKETTETNFFFLHSKKHI
jgi:FkbM family methyltransferase